MPGMATLQRKTKSKSWRASASRSGKETVCARTGNAKSWPSRRVLVHLGVGVIWACLWVLEAGWGFSAL